MNTDKKGNETKTDYLIERINQNESAQTIDINEWAFKKIESSDQQISILELCCGTGKQTAWLLNSFPNAIISCLDISKDSIDVVKRTFELELKRMKFYNIDIDLFFSTNKLHFDLIFCSYGLYYSVNIEEVLSQIYESLNTNGKFIVMGPFGKNNKQLFDILQNLKMIIPEAVIASSSTFMYEKVLKFSIENFSANYIYTTQNNIKWGNIDQVLSYWKNTTFFDPKKEEEFREFINREIAENGYFTNQKRIMLIQSVKHA
jgi:ubiquinone/menaquinone biosynthesis C-methylase UbiE